MHFRGRSYACPEQRQERLLLVRDVDGRVRRVSVTELRQLRLHRTRYRQFLEMTTYVKSMSEVWRWGWKCSTQKWLLQ